MLATIQFMVERRKKDQCVLGT